MSDEFVMRPLAKHVHNEPVSDQPLLPSRTDRSSKVPASSVSPSAFILQDAFAQFLAMAESKLDQTLYSAFVQSVSQLHDQRTLRQIYRRSFVSIAKYCPKLVIDGIMVWRKFKSDTNDPLPKYVYATNTAMPKASMDTIVMERKSLMANFILCRVLSEIIGQLDKNSMTSELGEKLEDMVFSQLKNSDTYFLSYFLSINRKAKTLNRQANVDFFSQLVGALSHIRFASVSQKFIIDLQATAATKESNLEQILQSMKHIKMKLYPIEDLECTVDFLRTISSHYADSHGKIKFVYTEVLADLFEPINAIANAEVNFPGWMSIIEMLYPKASKIYAKHKTLSALNLLTSLLCVSKPEFFRAHFHAYSEQIQARLKDRSLKQETLQAYIKIVWVYLYRNKEPSELLLNGSVDEFIRIFLCHKTLKKPSILQLGTSILQFTPQDTPINLNVLFLYYVSMRNLDYFVTVILPYLSEKAPSRNSSSTSTTNTVNRLFQQVDNRSFMSNLQAIESDPSTNNSITLFRLYALILIEMQLYFHENMGYGESIATVVQVEEKIRFPPPVFPTALITSLCVSSKNEAKTLLPLIEMSRYEKSELSPLSILPASFWARAGSQFQNTHSFFQTLSERVLRAYKGPPEPLSRTGTAQSSYSRGRKSHPIEESSIEVDENLLLTVLRCTPRIFPKSMGMTELIVLLVRFILSESSTIGQDAVATLKRVVAHSENDSEDTRVSMIVLIKNEFMHAACVTNPQLLFATLDNSLHPIKLILDAWLWIIESMLDFSNGSVKPYGIYRKECKGILDEIEAVGYFFLLSDLHQIRDCAVRLILRVELLCNSLRDSLADRRQNKRISNLEALQRNASSASTAHIFRPKSSMNATRLSAILREHGKIFVDKHCIEVFRKFRISKDDQIQNKQKFFESSESILVKLATTSNEFEVALWNLCVAEIHRVACSLLSPEVIATLLKYTTDACLMIHPLLISDFDNRSSITCVKTESHSLSKFTLLYSNLLRCAFSFIDLPARCNLSTHAGSSSHYHTSSSGSNNNGAHSQLESSLSVSAIIRISKISKLRSGQHLFRLILPFFLVEQNDPRACLSSTIKCTSEASYHSILEEITPYMRAAVCHIKARSVAKAEPANKMTLLTSTSSLTSLPQVTSNQNLALDNFCIQFTEALGQISHFITTSDLRNDNFLLREFSSYLFEFGKFLSTNVSDFNQLLLRRHFCVLVDNFHTCLTESIVDNAVFDVAENFSFEIRYILYKLCAEWGKTNHVTSDTYPINQDDLSNTILSCLECMAQLVNGPLVDARYRFAFDLGSIMTWIKDILSSDDFRLSNIGRRALKNLIASNMGNNQLITEIIHRCYISDSSHSSRTAYFDILADAIISSSQRLPLISTDIARFFCLSLFKSGSDDHSVRKKAAVLLNALDTSTANILSSGNALFMKQSLAFIVASGSTSKYPLEFESISLLNVAPISYKYAQAMLSAKFAELSPEYAFAATRCISAIQDDVSGDQKLNESNIKDLLVVMVPWLRATRLDQLLATKITLDSVDSMGNLLESEYQAVINNLIFLSIKYSDVFLTEIESIWMQLFNSIDSSTVHIFDYFIKHFHQLTVRTKSTAMLEILQRVSICISRSKASVAYFHALCRFISPKISVSITSKTVFDLQSLVKDVFVADLLSCVTEADKKINLGICHTAIILVSSFVIEIELADLAPLAPLLLHAAVCHVDHSVAAIHNQSRILLLNLVYALSSGSKQKDSNDLCDNLILFEGKILWPYEDRMSSRLTLTSESTLCDYVYRLIEISVVNLPDIIQQWAVVSVEWGANCPIRHVAARSFQILRLIASTSSIDVLAVILARLSSVVCDTNSDTLGFSHEIILTIGSLMDMIDDKDLPDRPEIFWLIVALMQSPEECEYAEAICMFERLLEATSLHCGDTVALLIVNRPREWDVDFSGLQPLLIRGLASQDTHHRCLALINTHSTLLGSPLFDTRKCAISFTIIANIEYLVQVFDDSISAKELDKRHVLAKQLIALCTATKSEYLASCLSKYAAHQFRSKADFYSTLASIIKGECTPDDHIDILNFLVQMLFHSTSAEVYSSLIRHFISCFGDLNNSHMLSKKLLQTITSQITLDSSCSSLDTLIQIIKSTIEKLDVTLKMLFDEKSIDQAVKDSRLATATSHKRTKSSHDAVSRVEYARVCRGNVNAVVAYCNAEIAERDAILTRRPLSVDCLINRELFAFDVSVVELETCFMDKD